jgi:hypothetical protein
MARMQTKGSSYILLDRVCHICYFSKNMFRNTRVTITGIPKGTSYSWVKEISYVKRNPLRTHLLMVMIFFHVNIFINLFIYSGLFFNIGERKSIFSNM